MIQTPAPLLLNIKLIVPVEAGRRCLCSAQFGLSARQKAELCLILTAPCALGDLHSSRRSPPHASPQTPSPPRTHSVVNIKLTTLLIRVAPGFNTFSLFCLSLIPLVDCPMLILFAAATLEWWGGCCQISSLPHRDGSREQHELS